MPSESGPPPTLSSLFGCMRILCEHHGVVMSLTLRALEDLVAGKEDLPAAEAALAGAGFDARRTPLTAEALHRPDRSFPLLAVRRQGGYVLIIGTRTQDGQALIGVFDPESGDARARAWTPDLVAKALAGEALAVVPARVERSVPAARAAEPGPPTMRTTSSVASARTAASPVERRIRKRRNIMADIYADAFENILVHAGTVRIDLATYSPREKQTDSDQPALETTGRLVMPLEGFVRAFGGMGEVVRQMVEAGLIEPMENPDSGSARSGGRH